MNQNMAEINNTGKIYWIKSLFVANVMEFDDDIVGFKKNSFIFKKIKFGSKEIFFKFWVAVKKLLGTSVLKCFNVSICIAYLVTMNC